MESSPALKPIFKDGTPILDKRYTVLGLVGKGAFGEIYKVQKCNGNQILAMKAEKPSKVERN